MAFSSTQACSLLLKAWKNQKLPHALLISSHEENEIGALIQNFVPYLNQNKPELPLSHSQYSHTHIIAPVSKSRQIRVDDIRNNEDFLFLVTTPNRWKVFIILDADCMNESAQNVFLKTLEEPPPWTLIILVAAQPEKLLPTIRSRCVKLHLRSPHFLPQLTQNQRDFLPIWLKILDKPIGFAESFLLTRQIIDFLASKQKTLTNSLETQTKQRTQEIKEHTDALQWSKELEENLSARLAIESLLLRNEIIELMIDWLGDALRLANGASGSLFPEFEESIRKISQTYTVPQLLKALDSLSQLRQDLNTSNVNELLAWEVFLTEAFMN